MKAKFSVLFLFVFSLIISAGETTLEDWWSAVTETMSCTIKAEEGDAVLRVELEIPDENLLEEVKDSENEIIGYSIKGKKLPERFWRGNALIKKFDLEWEGKKVDIPERFWTDLAGFRIQVSPLKIDALAPNKQYEGEQFLASLDQPRVLISADGGTLMIEWDRPEECDGRSTIRWIISKSGTILRHRHTPPHEC